MKKRLISLFLLFAVICSLGATAFAFGDATDYVDYGVEFILETPVTRGSSLVYDCDGGREMYNPMNGDSLLERVWGWSTCVDGIGNDVYHYTKARYEDIFGFSYSDWSSDYVWGSGQVYAYSPYLKWLGVAQDLKARVYYGIETKD